MYITECLWVLWKFLQGPLANIFTVYRHVYSPCYSSIISPSRIILVSLNAAVGKVLAFIDFDWDSQFGSMLHVSV